MTKNWLFAAVIGLVLFAVMQSSSTGQNQSTAKPERWQYHVEIDGAFREDTAGELGAKGWELVTVYRQHEGELRSIYKRKS